MNTEPVSPKDLFNDFVQIGVVVADLDQAIKVLTDVFGIGPFRVLDWPPTGRDDMDRRYYGQPADFTKRVAFAEMGSVELELIEPATGDSIWADFLKEHGPGIHHIRFNTLNLDQIQGYLSQHDIGVTQAANGIRPGTKWANFDTERLIGFTIEVLQKVPGTDGRTPQFQNNQAVV